MRPQKREFIMWRKNTEGESLLRQTVPGTSMEDAITKRAELFPKLYPDGAIVYMEDDPAFMRLEAFRINRGGLTVERL